ncbi:MAG TPA: putative zinc-binding metallopeptidase, partial [Verrucomicrobiae bacterium]|nr:putative zinc-binding metallopeptidase [Verrucomicrobiae bacterium]
RWRRIEAAKHRVVYSLVKFVLPTESSGNGSGPLRFQFLGDVQGQPPVKTGHENGMITVNIAEADDVDRERRRVSLHEPYRTLVGHFRHEVGHYYWDRLIANSPHLGQWRALFGDESRSYAEALLMYYNQGAAADWQMNYVSAYASSHPWEDWAETWAHYLHIVDTMETAAGFGLTLKPKHPSAKSMTSDPGAVCGIGATFDKMLSQWFPLVYALNSLNRGMGLNDLYPFALPDAVIVKLQFIHDLVQTNQCPPLSTAT